MTYDPGFYPGDEFVDVIGGDWWGLVPDADGVLHEVSAHVNYLTGEQTLEIDVEVM